MYFEMVVYPMHKILVVDDDPKIVKIIEKSLLREGYEVTTALGGKQAIEEFLRQEPALIVLDLMMPIVDGFQVCRTVRETSSIPIIIFSVRNDELDKILGFNLGIDDYLSKPFSPVELCLRVKAILRRTRQEQASVTPDIPIFSYNGVSVNPSTREVFVDDCPIELTAKEFDVLWFLAKNPNKVFTRKQLLYQLYQGEYLGNDESVTVLVSRLRDKIERDKGKPALILTVRGVGYKFIVE